LNDKSEKLDEQNCMDFFSTLLEEKDKKIQVLLSQAEAFNVKIRIMLSFPFKNVVLNLLLLFGHAKQIKEKQYNERIEDIS